MVEKAGPAQAEETAPQTQPPQHLVSSTDERWHTLHQLLSGIAADLTEIKEELKLK
jgi:hypothetical protein